MSEFLKPKQSHANISSAMEPETIQKNGANCHKSKINAIIYKKECISGK